MSTKETRCQKITKELKIRYSPFRLIPILVWIREYKLSFILRDVIAGITIGLMVTPQEQNKITPKIILFESNYPSYQIY